ncbi:alpha/beta-Hydrolases superfamily protein [Rhynchospora pubera]|uniref:Alpha/beta-Hydrolases superfamily protein n=1 Tax=Rhynchospora pubera TaxID=906938 RepID=A0AAV8FD14_9POAL|nr:alpha/beta-Hydrolases superfamily protein [Rhynchospora pubera]
MFTELLAVLVIAILRWAYNFIKPPASSVCGSPGGPPITSSRIKLKDGRHLAYRESGVPKQKAKYKIVLVHGFNCSKGEPGDDPLGSQELAEELGICFVSFDRAGYGESDPNPKRTVKSESMDVDELAEQLELGPKFYVIGGSMGAYTAYSCLKYIPHRLLGVALVVPAVNYWWPSLPDHLAKSMLKKLDIGDRMAFWVAHNFPILFHVWMKQKIFKPSPTMTGQWSRETSSESDLEIMEQKINSPAHRSDEYKRKTTQQGVYESLYQDVLVVFSNWEFDPMQIENPFPNNEGSVHLWAGREDRICQVEIQRYVAKMLPWIKYHENPHGGHLFCAIGDWNDRIIKALLLGEDPEYM